MKHETGSMKDAVIAKIKKGEATMRPRWHFVLRTTLFTLGAIIVALALLYLASFILFVLRETGLLFVPSFGLRGMGVFLFALPWFLILLALAFVFVLEVLVRRYAFAYRKPLLYSLAVIVLFVVVGGALIASLGLHQGFARYAKEGRIPVADALYRNYEHPMHDRVFPGVLLRFTEEGFLLKDIRNEEFQVVVTTNTRFPSGVDLDSSDRIVVFGNRVATSTIEAEGIRRIDNTTRPPHHMRGWGHPLPPPEFVIPSISGATTSVE